MSRDLLAFVRRELDTGVRPEIAQMARELARERSACAALFYGSVLRTGDVDGVLDFYLLTRAPGQTGLRGLMERWLWPEVSYHQVEIGGVALRAKVATLPLEIFRRAAEGRALDTTIWTRFVQPAALVWSEDVTVRDEAAAAVAAACATACRFAAVLGPPQGPARAYWTALFRQTYATELRMEAPGRESQILDFDPVRYDRLLPLGWKSAAIPFRRDGEAFRPELAPAERRRLAAAWRLRRPLGKPLNALRLIKAAFTFEGAARYAAWKIERHTGVHVAMTPWRERHPLLSAPAVLWRVRRARRRQADAR